MELLSLSGGFFGILLCANRQARLGLSHRNWRTYMGSRSIPPGTKTPALGEWISDRISSLKNSSQTLLSICSSVQFRYIPSRHCLSSNQQAYPTIICTLYFLIHLSFHQLVSFIRCCFLDLDCTQVFYFPSGNAFFFVFILFFYVLFFGDLTRNCTVFL